MVFQKSFLVILFMYFFAFAGAQKGNRNELDSLEQKLSVIYKNQPDKAIEIGTLILKNSKLETQKSRVLGLIAVSYFVKNDINKSTELLFLSKDEAEKTGDHELIAKTYGSIAHQYVQLNLYDKAKFYLDKAIEETNKLEDGNSKYFLRALSFLELGNIMFDEKNYRSANENYKRSLNQFQKMIEPGKQVTYHYRRSLYNIGNSYVSLNQLDSAEIYLNKSLEISDVQTSDLDDFIYTTLSQVYAQKGFYQRAVDSLLIVLGNENFDNDKLRSEIYLDLSRNYKNLNENEKYIFYNEKYLKLNDSLRQNNLQAISTAMEQEQREAEFALTEAGYKNQILIIGGVISFPILLILIGYLVYKRRKERVIFEKIIEELKEKKENQAISSDKEKTEEKNKGSEPNPVEEEILSKLEKFEKSQKFTNPKLTISTLAVQLKTNTTYLSEVINHYKGKNFNTYINELRINYICEKIYAHPEYLNYKISYLAQESGFASHSAFTTIFKSVTGISPSVFLRETAKLESYKPKKAR